jgi:DNA-binding response OmpR family regulator
MPEHILVVDDDRQLTSFLERYLSKQGFVTAVAASATQMRFLIEHRDFDLILLDLGLPDRDGMEVMRDLRRLSSVPIILLTVRDEVIDRVFGLELGADDYVSKPFEPRELLARIRSVLRRTRVPDALPDALPPQEVGFAGYTLDLGTRSLTRDADGIEIALTSTEFELLRVLALNNSSALSRERMLSMVYGRTIQVTDRTIDAHIARIRRKLDASPARGSLIQTVHGIGYTLAATVTRSRSESLAHMGGKPALNT